MASLQSTSPRAPPDARARATILRGFGHVTVSGALGIAALLAGFGVIRLIGGHLETLPTRLLIAFGTECGERSHRSEVTPLIVRYCPAA